MRNRLITIGTFDGLHRGHQKLIRWGLGLARRLGLEPMVALFAEPPRFYFRPELRVPLLTTPVERRAILKRLGVRRVRVLRFNRALAQTPHTRFFEDVLLRRWRAKGLLVGRDFAFGKGRKGDLNYLREACRERGIHLGILPLVCGREGKISSSRIRELLLAGKVEKATRLMGRPHAVSGIVRRGRGLGRRLGFPTANLKVPPGLVLPRGVYRVRVSGPFPKAKKAVCNIGTRPTIRRRGGLAIEVHIPGYSGRLYGHRLRVELLSKIRDEKRFASLAALKSQILKDVRSLLAFLMLAGSVFAWMEGRAQAESRWLKSLAEAQKASTQSGKPILADFSSVWCYSCYYMERHVLSGDSFGHLSPGFVLLKLDVDEEKGRALREKYAVRFLPSFLVLASSGAELGRIVGEQTESDFAKALGRLAGTGSLEPEPPARLELAKAVERKEPEEVLRALKILLNREGDCALANDVLSADELVAAAEKERRLESWRRQRAILESLVKAKVFGPVGDRCADLRSSIEALSKVYKQLGLESEEKSLLARAIDLFRSDAARLGIGQDRNIDDNLRFFLEKGGSDAEIDELYGRLTQAYPSDYVYAYRYAKYLENRKRTAEALSWARKAWTLSYGANRLDVARLEAEILLKLGRAAEARDILEREIKANRDRFPKEAESLADLLKNL